MTPTVGDDRRSGAQAVERAIRVLRAFEREEASLGVSQIAEVVGLPVSTVHRIVRALVAGSLLAQDPSSGRYHLGVSIALLGQLAVEQLGYEACRPVLSRLAADTGESVNLGVRSDDHVVVVLRAPSPQPLRFDQSPGTRVPVHASAMGKALLAFGDELPAAVAALGRLARLTPQTITTAPELVAELHQVRERGWALNDQERDRGVRALAAPVLDHSGRAVAAVAVQGPAVRLTDENLGTLALAVCRTASELAPLMRSD